MSECRCRTADEAARCMRAGTRMLGALYVLCQTREDYRSLWDGLPQVEAAPPGLSGADKLKTCKHRGRSVKGDGGKPLKRTERF